MKAYQASFINGIAFVGLGLWGYLGSSTPSPTALIPVFVGILILAFNKGLKKENKIIAHIVVLLTFLMIFGLIKPLLGSLSRANNIAILRVSIMYLTTFLAIISFIKSFKDARKNKK